MLDFASGELDTFQSKRKTVTFIQATTPIAATNYNEYWSIAIDMQIVRIISTLNVCRQRKRHLGGVTITEGRIQRVPRHIQRMTRRKKRSYNRWSFVIKIKNYALLRLFPSSSISFGSKRLHLRICGQLWGQ